MCLGFDFRSTNLGSSGIGTGGSEGSLLTYFYWFRCHFPLITYLNRVLWSKEIEAIWYISAITGNTMYLFFLCGMYCIKRIFSCSLESWMFMAFLSKFGKFYEVMICFQRPELRNTLTLLWVLYKQLYS